ncbi:unnamed protein product [Chrysoparadoxa australica]
MGFKRRGLAALVCVALVAQCEARGSITQHAQQHEIARRQRGQLAGWAPCTGMSRALAVRGGVKRATIAEDEDESEELEGSSREGAFTTLMRHYKSVPLATRIFLTLVLLCSAVDMATGEMLDSGTIMSLNWKRTFLGLELWRPFTGTCFLGAPSMHWATNIYFLLLYGKFFEQTHGTAQAMIFMFTTFTVLNVLASLLQWPFASTSAISSVVYVSSRINAMDSIPWQFGLTIQSWLLPFGLMAVDTLQSQQLASAFPHILGIVAGHFYHFFTAIYPKMGGRDWLRAPDWMKRRLDGEDSPNFMEAPEEDERPAGRRVSSKSKK